MSELQFKHPKMVQVYSEYKTNRGSCCENIFPLCRLCEAYLNIYQLNEQLIIRENEINTMKKLIIEKLNNVC